MWPLGQGSGAGTNGAGALLQPISGRWLLCNHLWCWYVITPALQECVRRDVSCSHAPQTGVALLEFQIPPWLSRYASFLFSFLGRGVCKFFPTAHCHDAESCLGNGDG